MKPITFRHLMLIPAIMIPAYAFADYAKYPGQFVNGNTMVRLIKESDTSQLAMGEAVGIIETIFDHSLHGRWNALENMKNNSQLQNQKVRKAIAELFICPPESVTRVQLVAIAKKFLDQNPERWHEPAHLLVSEAFKKAFPCNTEELFPGAK